MSTPPSGWYADPANSDQHRFWDGVSWTEQVQAFPAIASEPPHKLEPAGRKEAKAMRRAEKQATKEAKSAAQEAEEQESIRLYGREVLSQQFGGKVVRIYEMGFVRVGAIFTSTAAPVERLHSIQANADVTKKTGLGRGAAAVATGGLSLAAANRRGDVFLTIATSVTTHVLRESPPTSRNMTASRALEAAGNSVLSRVGVHTDSPASQAPDSATVDAGEDMRSRLQRLKDLLADELISDDEYEAKRTELLQGL